MKQLDDYTDQELAEAIRYAMGYLTPLEMFGHATHAATVLNRDDEDKEAVGAFIALSESMIKILEPTIKSE